MFCCWMSQPDTSIVSSPGGGTSMISRMLTFAVTTDSAYVALIAPATFAFTARKKNDAARPPVATDLAKGAFGRFEGFRSAAVDEGGCSVDPVRSSTIH